MMVVRCQKPSRPAVGGMGFIPWGRVGWGVGGEEARQPRLKLVTWRKRGLCEGLY